MVVNPTPGFWRGKRVLVTGHSGFKGGWLTIWLRSLDAAVTGIALPPDNRPNLFELARVAENVDSHFCDIRDPAALREIVRKAEPEIVLHLAAQPLVRAGYREPVATFSSNVMGTVHLLDCLRGLDSVRVGVMITTDKVYRDQGNANAFCEDDALGGHDPYSASKAGAEIVIASYRDAYLAGQGVAIASARAGNVIGGGDWSDDRLVPDAVKAWQSGKPLRVRRPDAIRPWQHVLEPLAGYLILAERLWERPALAGAYNFGPHASQIATVRTVVEQARAAFGTGEVVYEETPSGPHEADRLVLDISKTERVLGISPRLVLGEAVNSTIGWYRAQIESANVRELCEAQIAAFGKNP